MSDESADQGRPLGAGAYVVAGLSYIPLLGVVFGVVSIVRGLITRRSGGRKLVWIGSGGIAFTILVYGALFYYGFAQRGGIYDNLRTQLAQQSLNQLVPAIEFYRLNHGEYPPSLNALNNSQSKGFAVVTLDPRLGIAEQSFGQAFYYSLIDHDHYYLRAVAPDGKPFSPGALVPQVETSDKIGLVVDAPAN